MENMKKSIIYIGDDQSYWNAIQERFYSHYENKEFNFVNIDDISDKKYQNIFIDIKAYNPDIIYFDMTYGHDFVYRITKLIHNEPSMAHISLVALNSTSKNIHLNHFLGVDFVHIKCGEYSDVVNNPFAVAYPKEAKKMEYAKAVFKKNTYLTAGVRVCNITPSMIHIETNMSLEKDKVVEVDIPALEKQYPSKRYIVKKVYDSNLVYGFLHGYDLEITFVDSPEVSKEQISSATPEEKKEIADKINEFKAKLEVCKKRFRKWVVERTDAPKKSKVLAIDNSFEFFQNSNVNLERYPHVFKVQSDLTTEMNEVKVFMPSVIVFNFGDYSDNDEEEILLEDTEDRNKERLAETTDKLKRLIKQIKQIQDYTPYLLIFGCGHYSSKSFQDGFQYKSVIVDNGPLNFLSVVEIIKAFEDKVNKKQEAVLKDRIMKLKAKDPVKYKRIDVNDLKERRFYVGEVNEYSYGYYSFPIQLLSMTESDLTFVTKQHLGIVPYRLNFPIDMCATVAPIDGKMFIASKELKLYKALIHSIGEERKKNIRKFVNAIFFSDLNEKRKKEMEEYELKKKEVLNQKSGIDDNEVNDDSEDGDETKND